MKEAAQQLHKQEQDKRQEQMEEQSQELTQLSEQILDKFDREEREIESLNYAQASSKDNVNDIFNQIQNEDLEQEKYTDKKVQQVIRQ